LYHGLLSGPRGVYGADPVRVRIPGQRLLLRSREGLCHHLLKRGVLATEFHVHPYRVAGAQPCHYAVAGVRHTEVDEIAAVRRTDARPAISVDNDGYRRCRYIESLCQQGAHHPAPDNESL